MDLEFSGKEVELDRKDRRILYELSLNARRPLKEIARNARMSEQVLNYRMQNLIKKGVISGFVPLIRIDKLGLNLYTGLFRIEKARGEKKEQIIQHFLNNKNVLRVSRIGWRWDLAVDIIGQGAYSFSKLMKEITEKYSENIKNCNLLTPASSFCFKRGYLIRESDPEEACIFKGEDQAEKIDNTNLRILRALSEDARATNHKIAKQLSLASTTVKNRIRSMEEKGIIQGYDVMIRPWLFGAVSGHIVLKVYEVSDAGKRLFEFARSKPSIISFTKTITRQYSLGLECNNKKEFKGVVEELKDKFADVINDYEVIETDHDYQFRYNSLFG